MEKTIKMVLTAGELKTSKIPINSSVVIYDVLRASSTITAALAHGARSIIPVLTSEEAFLLYHRLKSTGLPVLLGGERQGEKITGFHLGNSPLEYTNQAIFDHIIIFTTTNGTKAMVHSKEAGAKKILIASLLNQSAIVSHLMREAAFTIICAGVKNEFAFEDFYAAGLMLHELLNSTKGSSWQLDDSALTALNIARHFHLDSVIIREGTNGRRLIAKEKISDVQFCSDTNRYPILPLFVKDQILLHPTAQLASN